MKTRTRTSPLPALRYECWNRVGFPHYGQLAPGYTAAGTVTETIEYETKGRKQSNICYHSRVESDAPFAVGPKNVLLWAHAGMTPSVSSRWLDESELWGRKLDGEPEDYTADLSNDRRSAQFSAATTLMDLGMKPMFNVPLAVLELKDAGRTIEYVSDIQNLAHAIRSADGEKYLRSIPLADLSKANLWYKYGIKPTFQDGRRAYKELSAAYAVVKPINNGSWKAGQKLRVPYSVSSADLGLFQSPDITFVGRLDAANGSCFVNTRGMFESFAALVKVTNVHGVVYGTLKHNIFIDPDSYKQARFNLGTGFLSTAYEVTPLSFLLDGLVDVGSWLRDMERRRTVLPFSPTFVEGIWMTERWEDRTIAEIPKTWIEPGPYNFVGPLVGFVDYTLRASFDRWATRRVDGNIEGRVFRRVPYDGSSVRPLGSGTLKGIPYKLGTGLALLLSKLPAARYS